MRNLLQSSPSLLSLALMSLFSLFLLLVRLVDGATGANAITPIPMELLNPRLTEFRRIDASGDDQITFSEFLLSDRPWMETMSRRFHSIDANSDGKVTRKEFETYFRGKDEEQERQRSHQQGDNFFKQLTVTVGPIVEREQEGDAQNGSRRMRYFTAGSRKFAAITHGTGLFPPSSPSSSSAETVGHDFDHHHFHNNFPYHGQFLLPSSPTILGSSQPSQHGRTPLEQQQQQQVTSFASQPQQQQREQTLKK